MRYVTEEQRQVPVSNEADIVIVGGGCTGAFAAIRAARLGARVVLVEQANCFGGVATGGMVCVWHTLMDTTLRRQIIGGLTAEVIERLKRVPNGIHIVPPPAGDPVEFSARTFSTHHLNTEELKIELDRLVLESGVIPCLHTKFAAPFISDGRLAGVFVENNNGRSVILGRYFIDASADGFLGASLGMETYFHETLQPASTAARVFGWDDLTSPNDTLRAVQDELGWRIGWDDLFPGVGNLRNWFKSNIVTDTLDADSLTRAEMECRLQIRKMMDILRDKDPMGKKLALVALSSALGIREGRQLKCRYRLRGEDLYDGTKFGDAIAFSCYPVDIHHENKPSSYRCLNGMEEIVTVGGPHTFVRWKTADTYPTYWQIPYRCMLPENIPNLLICGRCMDADKEAFAAIRVMTSLNQTGEAAGVAAFEALTTGRSVQDIDIASMKRKMKAGGSIVMDE